MYSTSKFYSFWGALFLSLFSLCLSNTVVLAQDKKDDDPSTLVKDIDHFDIYGGPMINVYLGQEDASAALGGCFAVILNRQFTIGGYGSGRTNEGAYTDLGGLEYDVNLRHSGLLLGYSINAKSAFHININAQLGWGSLRTAGLNNESIFAVTPYAELEANVTRFFRVSAGGGYRIVNGFDTNMYESGRFNAPTANVTFKFGWF